MSTTRMYNEGDWIAYHFCGGTSLARINSWKWYIPRPWSPYNDPDTTKYPDPQIIYNCTKVYGLNQGWPHVSKKWIRTGWEPLSDYNLKNPQWIPDDWPKGMQPKVEQVTHTFLPVSQLDIKGIADFDSPLKLRWDDKPDSWKVPNLLYWLDKDKLEKMSDPKHTNDPDKNKHKQAIEKFEKRKAQVLARKLEQ